MNIKVACLLKLMLIIAFIPPLNIYGQNISLPDSVEVRLIPKYDSVNHIHRFIFGENYRKEYSLPAKVPVIYISKIAGGLTPIQRGGGNQSKSLRLVDGAGAEWVLRSVEKYPEILLPPAFRETFAKDVIKDNMSAQHPFSALVVPVFAEATGLPHSNPIIGMVAPDNRLGQFADDFVNTVCLLEEREPLGKSDNSLKMSKRLIENSDIGFDARNYLKLKCLDVLLGDWDRHEDQWRWKIVKKNNFELYEPIPRDRDQVFYSSDGKIQRFTQSSWFLPMMQGYERDIQNINWFLWEGREINAKWFSELNEQDWNTIVNEFCSSMTDVVLENGLKRLPEPGYSLRHNAFLTMLQQRRAKLPVLMNRYYHFFNHIVDIELTNEGEHIQVADHGKKGLLVIVDRVGKNKTTQVYKRSFDPLVTREVRIYLHNGADKLLLNNKKSTIRLRIIAADGEKTFSVTSSNHNVDLYGKETSSFFEGLPKRNIRLHLSNDSANTAYIPKDIYRRRFIYPNLGFNNDDGLAVGLAFSFKNPGFRKLPFGNMQSFSFLYSFATSAIKLYYQGEWVKAIGNANFGIEASAFAPSNTQNYFGLGNETQFDENQNNLTYYRARFNLYQVNPFLSWRGKKSSVSIGPALQYYAYNADENNGRFITKSSQLHSSDSTTIARNKIFAGIVFRYNLNTNDNETLPTKGFLLNASAKGFSGLNSYSNDFSQINVDFAYHQKLDSAATVVISDRIGAGATLGKPAFFQAQFLGGQGNLLGYRQYRFAGEQVLYNNLEVRIKLANVVSYVLPGQFGLLGHYDFGRVWKRTESSMIWHQGVGGGLYFAPASLTVFRFVASYSKEGWYPYFALSFRY